MIPPYYDHVEQSKLMGIVADQAQQQHLSHFCWRELLGRSAFALEQATIKSRGARETTTFSLPFRLLLDPCLHPEFEWPSFSDIVGLQKKITNTELDAHMIVDDEDLLRVPTGPLTRRGDEAALQMRIYVIGHCSHVTNRLADITKAHIQGVYFLETMDTDNVQFCASFLHSASTATEICI